MHQPSVLMCSTLDAYRAAAGAPASPSRPHRPRRLPGPRPGCRPGAGSACRTACPSRPAHAQGCYWKPCKTLPAVVQVLDQHAELRAQSPCARVQVLLETLSKPSQLLSRFCISMHELHALVAGRLRARRVQKFPMAWLLVRCCRSKRTHTMQCVGNNTPVSMPELCMNQSLQGQKHSTPCPASPHAPGTGMRGCYQSSQRTT